MKLLPTGRKNAFYLTLYGSMVSAFPVMWNIYFFIHLMRHVKESHDKLTMAAWSWIFSSTSVLNDGEFDSSQFWI